MSPEVTTPSAILKWRSPGEVSADADNSVLYNSQVSPATTPLGIENLRVASYALPARAASSESFPFPRLRGHLVAIGVVA